MAILITDKSVLDDIVYEVQKLDSLEQRTLLTKLRVKALSKKKVELLAIYDKKKIKPPTMAQIDKWKHEARKGHA